MNKHMNNLGVCQDYCGSLWLGKDYIYFTRIACLLPSLMTAAVPVVLIQVLSCKKICCGHICPMESLECATTVFEVSKSCHK